MLGKSLMKSMSSPKGFKGFSKKKSTKSDMKSSSISPSVGEFEDMMSKVSSKPKKKSLFMKKKSA